MSSILIFIFNISSLLFVSSDLVLNSLVLGVFTSRYEMAHLEWFTSVSFSSEKLSHLKTCQHEVFENKS